MVQILILKDLRMKGGKKAVKEKKTMAKMTKTLTSLVVILKRKHGQITSRILCPKTSIQPLRSKLMYQRDQRLTSSLV